MITSTLGKALGGAAGGFVAASEEVCDILAQRSRPQLFSNALPPTVACSALEAVRVLRREPELVAKLHRQTAQFRERLREIGFKPLDGEAAIVPIIVGETAFAIRFSERLLEEGVFVTGFGFPVVPEGTARVRVQMSAAIEEEHMDRALAAFEKVGKELELIMRRSSELQGRAARRDRGASTTEETPMRPRAAPPRDPRLRRQRLGRRRTSATG